MDNIEKLSDILYKYFDYIYCENCRYETEVEYSEYSGCNECYRKNMYWKISKDSSDYLAEKIIKELNL